jgi:type III pantothenate kinase
MLLAIDIGNTHITFGIFKGQRLLKSFKLPTRDFRLSQLRSRLRALDLQEAVLCSVVPKATARLGTALRSLGIRPVIIGKDIIVPLKNLYRQPKQVGQDRLVNAYAAVRLYKAPAVIVDFGTAVTFDIVSKKGEYLGGLILPGLKISLDALNRNTALLPSLKLRTPKELIARDTENSMLSGVVFGFAALTDSLISRIRQHIGKGALALGTGGDIGLMARYCKGFDRIDPDLTLKGILMVFRDTSK